MACPRERSWRRPDRNWLYNMQMKIAETDIRDAFFDEVYRLAARDSNIVFLTADMGAFSLNRFRADLSSQYINVGVAEQNLVGIAAGLSLAGKKAFIYTIAPFASQRCYEQVKVDISGMKLPVVIIGSGPGITYSSDGPTHHALQDVAVMRALPDITIFHPADAATAAATARLAYENAGPVYVRLDKGIQPQFYDESADFSSGMTLLKEGRDITIIATGIMVPHAFKIIEKLARNGIDAGVIDIYRLKPINETLLLSLVAKSARLATLEEHSIIGGLGSAVSEILTDAGCDTPLRRFGLSEQGCAGYGDREWMHRYYGLDPGSVSQSILDWFKEGSIISAQSTLTLDDFARLLGTTVEDIPETCRELISGMDLTYIPLNAAETETILLRALKTIESGDLAKVGAERKPIWEKGWSENFQDFTASGYDLNTLLPKFVKSNEVMRLIDHYVMPSSANFETSLVKVLRCYLFRKYFEDVQAIYEFGCGTGLNLADLAKMFPDKQLYGLDWSKTAVEIVEKIAETQHFNLSGTLFDMFSPDHSLLIPTGSAVFTIGAMEQLGTDFEPFLQFLRDKSFSICINIETSYELYDQDKLFDYVAAKYLEKRGYLRGYLARLQQLAGEGKIDIIKMQKSFGSLYHDGYSFVVWKPKK